MCLQMQTECFYWDFLPFSVVFAPKIRFKLPECFPKFATLFPNVSRRMRVYYGRLQQISVMFPEQSPKLPECLRKNVPNFPNST